MCVGFYICVCVICMYFVHVKTLIIKCTAIRGYKLFQLVLNRFQLKTYKSCKPFYSYDGLRVEPSY